MSDSSDKILSNKILIVDDESDIVDLIKYTDNMYKNEIGYIPASISDIAAAMTILEECWNMNKEKMNLIMDKNIITINEDN